MVWLMDAMGRPDQCAPVVHVTGTNGKTTTARAISKVLKAVGLRVGTYTSPHLQRVNERIAVDCTDLSDDAFVSALEDVMPFLELMKSKTGEAASYFEITTAMGFAAFAEAPVSTQVLEVGLGGRWDASNVADAEVAVITNVAVDHTEYLGSTPVEIAGEKSGIIKAGSKVVLGLLDSDVGDVVEAAAAAAGSASLVREGVDFALEGRSEAIGGQMIDVRGVYSRFDDLYLPLFGGHQAHNVTIAIAAAEALAGGELDSDAVTEALAGLKSPGRIEVAARNPLVILDCAHNPAGAEALVAALAESFLYENLYLVIGISSDKDCSGIISAFEPLAAAVIACQFEGERAMPAADVAEEAINAGCNDVRNAGSVETALQAASELAGEADLILVTGSIYTVGEARSLLLG